MKILLYEKYVKRILYISDNIKVIEVVIVLKIIE